MVIDALIHLALIWTGVLLASYLALKTRLTPVLWYMFVGATFANLGIIPAEPLPFIEGFAELGIIVVMFALGFEESTENFIRSVKRSWGIALFGALAPFFTAYGLALFFWGDQRIALMVGLAMTATAVSLTLVSLRSEGLQHTPAATGIMTSAVLDDIASLAMVAIMVPIALGSGPASITEVSWIIVKVILFFMIVVTAGAWLFPHDIRTGLASRIPVLRDFGIRHLIWIEKGTNATLIMFLLALLMGLLAHAFGFHPAVGAYMAGLVLREEYFHVKSHRGYDRYERTRQIIDDVAFIWIGPVFFVTLGGRLVFDAGLMIDVLDHAIVLFVSLFVAQVTSAALAARYTGRFTWPESIMIGLGMLGRAELAMVVLSITYVQNAILSREAFYSLMLTATMLNIAVPVSIRLWRPYFTGDKALPAWMGERPRPRLPDGSHKN